MGYCLGVRGFFLLLILLGGEYGIEAVVPIAMGGCTKGVYGSGPQLFGVLRMSFLGRGTSFLGGSVPFPAGRGGVGFWVGYWSLGVVVGCRFSGCFFGGFSTHPKRGGSRGRTAIRPKTGVSLW